MPVDLKLKRVEHGVEQAKHDCNRSTISRDITICSKGIKVFYDVSPSAAKQGIHYDTRKYIMIPEHTFKTLT